MVLIETDFLNALVCYFSDILWRGHDFLTKRYKMSLPIWDKVKDKNIW